MTHLGNMDLLTNSSETPKQTPLNENNDFLLEGEESYDDYSGEGGPMKYICEKMVRAEKIEDIKTILKEQGKKRGINFNDLEGEFMEYFQDAMQRTAGH